MIVDELSLLREHSENNNIVEVNKCVNSFLSNLEFWILRYESIKSNPGVNSLGGSFFTGKVVTIDGIDLEFFHKLSIKIFRGNSNFGPIKIKGSIFLNLKEVLDLLESLTLKTSY